VLNLYTHSPNQMIIDIDDGSIRNYKCRDTTSFLPDVSSIRRVKCDDGQVLAADP
jgi:hypothetical protein